MAIGLCRIKCNGEEHTHTHTRGRAHATCKTYTHWHGIHCPPVNNCFDFFLSFVGLSLFHVLLFSGFFCCCSLLCLFFASSWFSCSFISIVVAVVAVVITTAIAVIVAVVHSLHFPASFQFTCLCCSAHCKFSVVIISISSLVECVCVCLCFSMLSPMLVKYTRPYIVFHSIDLVDPSSSHIESTTKPIKITNIIKHSKCIRCVHSPI